MSIPKEIKLTGNVYITGLENHQISKATLGDVAIYIVEPVYQMMAEEYLFAPQKGYFKAKIFDGKFWQHIDITEFCTQKENKFSKKQNTLDTAALCQDILKQHHGTILKISYRNHYVIS